MSMQLLGWCLRGTLLVVKVFAWTIALTAAAAGMLFALPGVIDWKDLKPELCAMLTATTGRAVSLDGPLLVQFLPWPTLSANNVRLANAPGAPTRSLLEVGRLDIRLSLKALIRGQIEITRIVLDKPQLAIEPGADGRPNWWLPALESGSDNETTGLPLTLDQIEVRDCRLLHAVGLVDQPLAAQDINLLVTLGSQQRHVNLEGAGIVNGLPMKASIKIQTGEVSRPPLIVQADLPGGRLTFEGWAGQRSRTDPLRGRVTVSTTSPAKLIDSLAQVMHRPPLDLNTALLRQVEAGGNVSLDGQHLSIRDLVAVIDGEKISGDLGISADDTIVIGGHLAMPGLDADHWIRHLRAHSLLAHSQTTAGSGPMTLPLAPRLDLTLQIGEMRYRNDLVRTLVVALKFDDEGFHVREAMAILPGDCHLYYRVDETGQASADRPDIVDIEAHRLRETLKWIGIDTSSVPADRLQHLRVKGRTHVLDGAVMVTGATLSLDNQSGTGTARATLAIPTKISVRLDLPWFDLDSYRLTEQALHGIVASTTESRGSAPEAIAPPPVIDLSVKLDQLKYRGEAVQGVDAQISVQGNRLTLKRVEVENLLGSHIEITGSVDGFATSPQLDLAWHGVVPDIDRVLDYAGLPRYARGRVGAGQTAGRAVGSLSGVQLSNFSLDMLDMKITAEGHVAFGNDLRFDFPRLSLVTPDIGVIVAVARGTAHRPIAELRATGSFRGDDRSAKFQGDITLDGMHLSGELGSTLDSHPTISVALEAQQTLRLDRWLSIPSMSVAAGALRGRASRPAAEGEPAWPSRLKSLDGNLSFTASTIAWGPYEVTGVTLSVRLDKGRLEVERFAGSLGGASVRLSATVDAQQVPVALSLDGELRDIDVSRMIAMARTANDFGTDDLAVALNGKVSLEDVALRARGATLDAALLTLSGKGRATGSIQPVVTRGSLSLAGLATGIFSLFSNEMGFASAIIENFVGRWVNSQGTLEVGNGIVHVREYLFQGENATALLRGQIDAVNEALDTRIELNNKDKSLDYSMSLRGPLRTPELKTAVPDRQ